MSKDLLGLTGTIFTTEVEEVEFQAKVMSPRCTLFTPPESREFKDAMLITP
jgi:hypothetical protein